MLSLRWYFFFFFFFNYFRLGNASGSMKIAGARSEYYFFRHVYSRFVLLLSWSHSNKCATKCSMYDLFPPPYLSLFLSVAGTLRRNASSWIFRCSGHTQLPARVHTTPLILLRGCVVKTHALPRRTDEFRNVALTRGVIATNRVIGEINENSSHVTRAWFHVSWEPYTPADSIFPLSSIA